MAERSTIIDPATADHIELLASLGARTSKLSLFGILNKCSTPSGVRLLRSNLYQPPIDRELIQDRLTLVEELITDAGFFNSMKNILSRFPDLDPVLNLCVKRQETQISNAQIDAKIDRMVSLKQVLQLLPAFNEILSKSKSKICVDSVKMFKSHVKNSSLLLEMMYLVLVESNNIGLKGSSSSVRFSRAMAVKADVNGLLDLARKTFCDYVEQLEEEVSALSEAHQAPMKLLWNNNRGFCIQINNQRNCSINLNKLPEEFIRIVKTKSGVTFVTQEFAVKDTLTKDSLVEINKMSNAILNELLNEVREYIGFLYMLSDTISTLDMLVSFANVSMTEDYIKPEFGDSLVIRGGRHPILERVSRDVTCNDIKVDILSRLQILTGPNMSGKSTYLRQVVLLTIMAQCGCFVPATLASLRITDRIFSRVSTRDSIETNASTFMVEMQETAFILGNLSQASLVIIDELGRGTSVEEGTAICWAVAEALLRSPAFVLLATHFGPMTSLAAAHPCVENLHFLSQGEAEQVVHTHQLVRGRAANTIHYGLELATKSSFPARIVDKAKLISQKMKRNEVNLVRVDPFDQLNVEHVVKLKKLERLGLTGDELRQELINIKMSYLEESKDVSEVRDRLSGSHDHSDAASSSLHDKTHQEPSGQGQEEQQNQKRSIFHVTELDEDPDAGCVESDSKKVTKKHNLNDVEIEF